MKLPKSSSLKRSFEQIEKTMKSNGLDTTQLQSLKKKVFDKIEGLIKEANRCQLSNRPTTPLEKRFVKIVDSNTCSSKITYRPDNGECLIKLGKNTPDWKRDAAMEFGNYVVSNISDKIKLTLRGTLKWSETKQNFHCNLFDNSKNVYHITL